MIEEQEPKKIGPLKFHPDERRLAKLARLRRLVILLTLFLVGAALLWLILFPTRVSVVNRVSEPMARVVPVETAGRGAVMPVNSHQGVKAEEERVLLAAAHSVAVIDSGVNCALSNWKRAEALITGINVREYNIEEVLRRIGLAQQVSESAEAILGVCEEELRRLQGMLSHSGITGLRIGQAYGVARDYLILLRDEAGDRKSWLSFYEQAVRALSEKDPAGFDIKMNVAGGYRRSFEVRQRRLIRAGRMLGAVRAGLIKKD